MDRVAIHPPLNPSTSVAVSLALAACAITMIGVWSGFELIFAAMLVVAMFVAVRKAGPVGQVAFLMVAIQLNIFSIEFGDRLYTFENFYTLRPATAATAIMLVLLLWRLLNGTEKLGYVPLIRPLLLLDAAFFLATLLHPNSPFFFRGLISCILLAVNIGIFVLFLRQLLPNPDLIDRAVRWLIAMYAIYAAAGILMVLVNLSGLDPHDHLVQIDTLGNYTMATAGSNTPIPRPWSFEPNTGSQMVAVCLLALTKSLQRDERHRGRLWLCAALIFIGVMLTFARGAWVGLGVGLIGMLIITRVAAPMKSDQRARVFRSLSVISVTVVGSYLVLVNLLPYLKDVLFERILTLSVWEQGTMYERFVFWMRFIEDGIRNPILGHGADAYKTLIPPPHVSENFVIESFHAAGIAGPLIFGWFHWKLLKRAILMIRADQQFHLRWMVPFLAAYSGYFVAVQTNPNIWGAFFWMFLAFMVSLVYQESSRNPSRLQHLVPGLAQSVPPA
jgi:hypothetical protein